MFGLRFVLTRDSWIIFWTKIVAVASLVATGAIDPAALGLTEKQKHLVMGICSAIGLIAAQLSTSILPSKADAEKVSVPVKEQP